MKRFLLFLLLLTAFLPTGCDAPRARYFRMEGFAQGGSWHIICSLPRGVRPKAIKTEIDSVLLEIDRSLSGYNRGSLLSRLNAGEDLPLDDHFLVNFRLSEELWRESGGAFDPSAAPLFDLWGFGFTDGSAIPSRAQIDSVRAFIGMDKFRIDSLPDGSLHLRKADPRCRLNFNAIAQGYSCDRIGQLLEAAGSGNYLVEVGREILCKGLSARGDKWSIGVETPDRNAHDSEAVLPLQDTLHVTDCAVVTSGDYRKFYEKEGKRYAHTIDPRTGEPVTHGLLSATVIVPAESDTGRVAWPCARADARATWSMVIGRCSPSGTSS